VIIGLAIALLQPQSVNRHWRNDPIVHPSPEADPWERFRDASPSRNTTEDPFSYLTPERLGSGPHVLVISDQRRRTQVNYRSGPACQRARDVVRRQLITNLPGGGQIIPAQPQSASQDSCFCKLHLFYGVRKLFLFTGSKNSLRRLGRCEPSFAGANASVATAPDKIDLVEPDQALWIELILLSLQFLWLDQARLQQALPRIIQLTRVQHS
jgi:hypothetical protein